MAGILSFVSPCVLPLVPGYLSFISGVSLDAAHTGAALPEGTTRQVFFASLAFVLGFTCVFVALGASASSIGALINEKLWILDQDRRRRRDPLRPAHDGGAEDQRLYRQARST